MDTPPRVCRLLCFVTVLATSVLPPAIRAQENARAESAPAPLVVIGASASAGFVPTEPFGGAKTPQYRFTNYIAAALLNPTTPTKNLAATTFFLEVDKQAKRQIEEALAAQPAAVIGLDFLFWFCYGNVANEENRPVRFERGLAYLDQLTCPLVIGDIPDASAAVGGILGAKELPKPEVIVAANRRLAEWAATRENVSLISLNEFMSACMNDRALKIGSLTWPEGQTRKLLQSDKLHPARHGCAVLALAVMNALTRERGIFSEKDVRWDVEEVYRRALEAVPPPKAVAPPVKVPVPASQ